MDKDKRKERNKNLIERMRHGDPLNLIEPQATWYPPRPIIAKNKQDIARLYGDIKEKSSIRICGDSDDTAKNGESDGQMFDRT